MERYTDSQTYYIVFDKALGLKRRWWLHREFQHVHLLRDNRDFCLMINSMAHVMAVKEYPNTLEDILQQEILQNPTAILQRIIHYGACYKPSNIEILTCVSVAKRVLGIRNRWVLTPRQLYKELLRSGALTIKPYTPDL